MVGKKGDDCLTDLEYALMKKIQDGQPYCEDLLSQKEQLTLTACIKNHWVRFTSNLDLVLTAKGENALLEHEYALQKEAKEKAEAEHERVRQKSFEQYTRRNEAKASRIQWLISMAVDFFISFIKN